jgi:hypothetical protein
MSYISLHFFDQPTLKNNRRLLAHKHLAQHKPLETQQRTSSGMMACAESYTSQPKFRHSEVGKTRNPNQKVGNPNKNKNNVGNPNKKYGNPNKKAFKLNKRYDMTSF